MNARQTELLKQLMRMQSYATTAFLAEKLNCSERTIRNDIPKINDYLARIGVSSTINSKTGSGLRFEHTPEDASRIRASLDVDKVELSESLYRFYHGLFLIVSNPAYYTQDTLSHALYTNKQQLARDISAWNELLSSYQAHINSRSRLEVVGPEINIRFFLVYFCYQLADKAMKQKYEPLIFSTYQQSLFACIDEMERNTRRSYSLNAKHQIALYIVIMIKRIEKGRLIHRPDSDVPLSNAMQQLIYELEALFSVQIPHIEAKQLEEVLLISNRGFSLNHLVQETPSAEAKLFGTKIVEELLLSLLNTKDLSLEIKNEIINVCQQALVRKAHNLDSAPSQEVSFAVGWDHMSACLFLHNALYRASDYFDKTLFTSDYTRIELLLIPFINTYFKPNRWTCGLVVDGGIEQAEFLKQSILSCMKNVDIPFIFDSVSVQKTLGQKDLRAVDFFVGFEDLNLNRPYLRVSKAFNTQDKIAGLQFLDRLEYPTSQNTQSQLDVTTIKGLTITRPQGVLEDLYEFLLEEKVWKGEFKAFLRHAHIGSLSHDDWMVLTMTTDHISHTCAYLFDTKGFMLVTGKKVKHIAVLLVHSKDTLAINAITSQFKQAVIEYGFPAAETVWSVL